MQTLEVPRLKPAAPDTWELRTTLADTEEESIQVTLTFPCPYLIVGAHASVIASTSANDVIPTADDILALLNVDNQRNYTSSNKGTTTAASRGAQYVTLASLDTQFRDLHIELKSNSPVLSVSFRWRIGALASGFYEDADIALSLFCTPLK